jgi:formylglycine-generating enzyme required for sulfatase activity
MCNYRPVGDERITAIADTSKDKFGVMNTFEVVKNKIGDSYIGLSYTDDGGTYTVPVTAYDPNGYGLYNMSGNVAEMVSEKGIARGGSWASTGFDVRIKSEQKFENTSPEIGFRYFMEVIEK